MAYEWAVPGAKCVCIDDGYSTVALPGSEYVGDLDGLARNSIYTIRAVGPDILDGDRRVWLVEILRENDPDLPYESGFSIARFRPLITRSQEHDVALFAPILHGQPVGA